MKKISKWSIVGGASGLAFALFSGIRYYWIFPDTDKAIVYVIIGALIMAVSYFYDWCMKTRYDIEVIEDFLQDKKTI